MGIPIIGGIIGIADKIIKKVVSPAMPVLVKGKGMATVSGMSLIAIAEGVKALGGALPELAVGIVAVAEAIGVLLAAFGIGREAGTKLPTTR
jgi:hypothetical protein